MTTGSFFEPRTLTLGEELGTALFSACAQDNVVQVKKMTINNDHPEWSKLLCAAASGGATKVAAYCMEQGAKIDDDVLNWIICNQRSTPVYRFFVESGAVDVNRYIEWQGDMLGAAAKGGRHEFAQFLLENGADPNLHTIEARRNQTALACAAQSRDEEMVRLLLDHGARLTDSGALVLAAERGKLENVRLLITRGADVNEIGVANRVDPRTLQDVGTALHKAVENGHMDVIDELLTARADVTLKDGKGRTAAEIGRAKGLDDGILKKLDAQAFR